MSKATADESVVAVTAVPALPARSEKEILKAMFPSVSPEVMAREAVHAVGPPETVAEEPPMVTVGVPIDSDEVNETVTVSPVLALEVMALFEAMETDERVGAVVSITIAFCPAIELTPPTAGKVNVALFRAASLIVPPFKAREEVET